MENILTKRLMCSIIVMEIERIAACVSQDLDMTSDIANVLNLVVRSEAATRGVL